MKKKHIKFIAVFALILSLAGLAFSGFIFSRIPEDQSHLIDDLYQENQELRAQISELNGRLDKFMTVTSLKNWSLEASPWADSTGADVTFTATPSDYQQGVGATLLVTLDSRQIASVPCIWDGTTFTATAGLSAADGYSYYCVLTGPSGVQQLALMNPDSPDAGIPVYLYSSLSSYCNLVVSDWIENSATLMLTSAYAQVQLPRICADDELTIINSELVLRLNGQIAARIPIKLAPSEVEGSYDVTLTDLHMPMPELSKTDALELYLEVSLSDGRNLRSFGISWQLEDGKLSSAVG